MRVLGSDGAEFARGQVNYARADAERLVGRRSGEARGASPGLRRPRDAEQRRREARRGGDMSTDVRVARSGREGRLPPPRHARRGARRTPRSRRSPSRLEADAAAILAANAADVADAEPLAARGEMAEALLARLRLDEAKLAGMVDGRPLGRPARGPVGPRPHPDAPRRRPRPREGLLPARRPGGRLRGASRRGDADLGARPRVGERRDPEGGPRGGAKHGGARRGDPRGARGGRVCRRTPSSRSPTASRSTPSSHSTTSSTSSSRAGRTPS